jgi:hypothetical protein
MNPQWFASALGRIFPLSLECAQMAKFDEEVFGTDCNYVARSWRV